MILLETKSDLVENLEENDTQFREFCVKNNFINGFRTSSKLGLNIVESMDFLIKHIIEKLEKIYNDSKPVSNGPVDRKTNIVLDRKKNNSTNKKSNCC